MDGENENSTFDRENSDAHNFLKESDLFKCIRHWKVEKPRNITFAGVIGVGKSTMSQKLSSMLKCPLYVEKVEGNSELMAFYAELANVSEGDDNKDENKILKTAFPLQISLLTDRLEQHQRIATSSAPGHFTIQDRSIFEDAIFVKILCAKGFMSHENGALYFRLFSSVYKLLRHPSVIVYLRASPEVCYERIKRRNRPMEKLTLDYIQDLCAGYDAFFENMKGLIPILVVDYEDDLDVASEEYTKIANYILDKIEEIVHFESAPAFTLCFNGK